MQAVSPEGQYAVNSKIVDFFKKGLGGKFIYTIGGYSIGEANAVKPRVFGNATARSVIISSRAPSDIRKVKGLIWGSAGLIMAFAKMEKIDGVCLMGETSFLDMDASAAKAVIIQLAKRLARRRHHEPRQDNSEDRQGAARNGEAGGRDEHGAAAGPVPVPSTRQG